MIRNRLTIFSLIGLLLSMVLWGMSYFRPYVGLPHDNRIVWLGEGSIVSGRYNLSRLYERTDDGSVIFDEDGVPQKLDYYWGFTGFMGLKTEWLPRRYPVISVPLWMVALTFAMLYCRRFIPLSRRRKRMKLGLCLKCGYDLRGLPEPRCPECGTEFQENIRKPSP